MRRDWRGPSSSSTISSVRLGFMTWLEACSARTVVSKWIVADILRQFSMTPAPLVTAGGKTRTIDFTSTLCFHPIKAVRYLKNKDLVLFTPTLDPLVPRQLVLSRILSFCRQDASSTLQGRERHPAPSKAASSFGFRPE